MQLKNILFYTADQEMIMLKHVSHWSDVYRVITIFSSYGHHIDMVNAFDMFLSDTLIALLSVEHLMTSFKRASLP